MKALHDNAPCHTAFARLDQYLRPSKLDGRGQRTGGTGKSAGRSCRCGGTPELRHCYENNSVGWQCSHCHAVLSRWIPRRALSGVDVCGLPGWVSRRYRRMVGAAR